MGRHAGVYFDGPGVLEIETQAASRTPKKRASAMRLPLQA